MIPSKFTYSMIKPAFGSCYGLIKYKWFSKLQFKSLRIKSNLFDEYYKDTCAIRKSDMIAFLQENSVYSLKDGIGECEATIQIYVGEKEKQSMKKSAKIIHEKLQKSWYLLFTVYSPFTLIIPWIADPSESVFCF